jgi:hypothetical protein
MNCQHCEKKLPELYFTDNVNTTHVNEVGQTVDTGKKEMYYCDYECSRKYLQHYLVKKKINFMKKAKHWAEELEESYEEHLEDGWEHGDMPNTLTLIHYYKSIINFIRGKINKETFQIIAQDAMEVGEEMGDSIYLVIVRDTQYAISMMVYR